MQKLIKQLEAGENYFGSGSYNSEEFKRFFTSFKKEFTKILIQLPGYTNCVFNRGHFYLSGFFKIDTQCYYFSISDVRTGFNTNPQMLIRTAKNFNDYTGGINNYVSFYNLKSDIERFLRQYHGRS